MLSEGSRGEVLEHGELIDYSNAAVPFRDIFRVCQPPFTFTPVGESPVVMPQFHECLISFPRAQLIPPCFKSGPRYTMWRLREPESYQQPLFLVLWRLLPPVFQRVF